MKRFFTLFEAVAVVLLATVLVLPNSEAAAQITNNANATQSQFYGNWMAQTLNANASGATKTFNLNTCYFHAQSAGWNQGANPAAGSGMPALFFPLATNVPVTIVDGALTETVTPSAVAAPTVATPSSIQPYACSFTATVSNAHTAGVTIISGDGGLAEAANDNGKAYGITGGAITYTGFCTTAPTTASTFYLVGLGMTGGAALTCNQGTASQVIVMPRAGVAKNLTVAAGTGGYTTTSGVVTLVKNGTGSALTCTTGTATSCSDVTHAVTFAAGDYFTVTLATATGSSTETIANVVASFEYF